MGWGTGTLAKARRARSRLRAPAICQDAEPDLDGETLVVSKLDRLGRDAQDAGATTKALARAASRLSCGSSASWTWPALPAS